MYLELKTSAGDDVKDCLKTAALVAQKLNVSVLLSANGVGTMVNPNADPIKLYEIWEEARYGR